MNIAAPERQYPVVHFKRSGYRDDQSRRREEEAKVGIHTTDIHVVCPNNKAQRADDDDRPHHHSIAEDILSRMNTDQIRNNAERWKRDDVNLGMTKEPKKVLKQ